MKKVTSKIFQLVFENEQIIVAVPFKPKLLGDPVPKFAGYDSMKPKRRRVYPKIKKNKNNYPC